MRALLEALVLGIVQGLTEFLPVSSSGHLELMKFILGNESTGEQSLLMTVVLHFATACATLYVFRKEVWKILQGLFGSPVNASQSFSIKIVLSMIPAVFIGLFFEEAIEAMFSQNLLLVGLALCFTALLLVVADRAKQTDQTVSYMNALVIGAAQAIAIIPGISRSGATISTSVLLHIDRDQAASFSFLMVVPLIFGKIAKDVLAGDHLLVENFTALSVGFLAAFFTGILACIWMIRLVRRANLRYFGWYCALVGIIAVILSTIS
ncbi:MAG: undecaprenyl-diphosphate phosphatase [Saprospiraceae bacterium]|nr:undecaprenyl-diphosphate phosphatase [Saprospiraceae bacterium]